MKPVQAYVELKKRQQKELEDFPIAYAFSNKQLEEALVKLGADSAAECVTVFGHGDIVKRSDAPKLVDIMRRHTEEIRDAMRDEEFAEAAFLYEMDNHEYAINWSGDEDVLAAVCLDNKLLKEYGLKDAYRRATRAHMKNAVEWGMI